MPLTKANRIMALRKKRINLLSSAMKNVCRTKADLPGWPLLPSTPSKVEMQKCEKCSKEFCSTINYRRHIRMHRRSPNIDKEFQKNRDKVGMFWDKLDLEGVKAIVSLGDVDLEGTSGTTILKYLSLRINRPNISSLPSSYVKAGSLLMGIVRGEQGCLPVTSKELFGILDDASENTFMCAGNATLVQQFLFDGDAEKIIIEMKNFVTLSLSLSRRSHFSCDLSPRRSHDLSPLLSPVT